MPTITSAGVGSGIDIESIISSLMAAERAPLRTIEENKNRLSIQLSAYGELKSHMSAMKDMAIKLGSTEKFGNFIAASSDEEIFTATATSGTISEEHDINVISLAETHRLNSGLYANADSAVGTGTYSFSAAGESFDIIIDGTNDSLTGLRDAINDAADNTTINASVINVDGGSRLILSAKEAGTANAITAPPLFTELTAASDATFEIDGFTAVSSSNTVNDVIPGISLELKSVGSAQLTSSRDVDSIKTTLQDFISSYNTVRTNISTMSEGTLQGESLMRSFESRIRQDFFSEIILENGETLSPLDLGFTFDKEGVLSLDESEFNSTSSVDLESFINAFTDSENGFAKRIEDTIAVYTQAGGLIDNRTEGLDNRTASINEQIERFEFRLEQTEARYRRQFSAMDALVSQLQASGDYMLSQLASLNNNNR